MKGTKIMTTKSEFFSYSTKTTLGKYFPAVIAEIQIVENCVT